MQELRVSGLFMTPDTGQAGEQLHRDWPYQPNPGYYDEMVAVDGTMRPRWRPLIEPLERMGQAATISAIRSPVGLAPGAWPPWVRYRPTSAGRWTRFPPSSTMRSTAPTTPGTRSRSEERRGGKECRSRWSPYH